jgi:hypothetical protein
VDTISENTAIPVMLELVFTVLGGNDWGNRVSELSIPEEGARRKLHTQDIERRKVVLSGLGSYSNAKKS